MTTEQFVAPEEIVVGRGAVEEVGEQLSNRGTTALVVATSGVFDSYGDHVLDSLEAAGITASVYDEVRPDPTVENVEQATAAYREGDCDCLVALGGGSPIDTAKAVGVVVANGGEIREYGVDRAGYEGVSRQIPPLCAVPTTAGTGSEATRSIVITDESTATKFLVVSTAAMPTIAIEDPTLVTSLPQHYTAFTGIDALTHAIEAYVSVHAWELSDTLARSAIERIGNWLPASWANGDDVDAREEMLLGQLHAGQAFTNSSVALVHGMARPFGAQLHVPHGLANGVLLPHVMEFSLPGARERYADIGRLLGAADETTPDRTAAEAAVTAVREYCSEIRLYDALGEFGEIPSRERYLGVVEEMAGDAIGSGSPDNNPRKPTADEIEQLYVTVYDDILGEYT